MKVERAAAKKEAECLCILLFFNYNATEGGVPPAEYGGGAFLLSATGTRLLRGSAIHFVELIT